MSIGVQHMWHLTFELKTSIRKWIFLFRYLIQKTLCIELNNGIFFLSEWTFKPGTEKNMNSDWQFLIVLL